MLINAKKELLSHIKDREVEFVSIAYYNDDIIEIKGTLDEVLPKLDFEYDAGFGIQQLNGYIWYTDGTWSDRGEYDGSEWWQHQVCPPKDIEVDI